MDNMKPLKPCPFCDTELNERENIICDSASGYWYVQCFSCGMKGPVSSQWNLAIDAWNKLPREYAIHYKD